MSSPRLSLTVSLADQNFARTKSVGIFNLATGLVERLAARTDLDALTVLGGAGSDDARWPDWVKRERHEAAAAGRLARLWWDQWGVYSAARRSGNEWLLLPKGYASFVRRPPVKLAVYVHDAMLDFYRRNHPAGFGRAEELYFRCALRGSLRHARVIFTNTAFTASEVQRLAREAGMPPVATVVAGIGFKPTAPTTEERRGLVVLASPFPHKLTGRAVEWLARWQTETGFDAGVTWVGRLPDGLRLPELRGWVRHERLPEAAYRALLARARVLVFFSEYEGFGMPPVEAAIAGACPVFSRIPPTVEAMGAGGEAFDNGDYQSFFGALQRARETPPERIAAWRAELLARHDWQTVAGRVVEALRERG